MGHPCSSTWRPASTSPCTRYLLCAHCAVYEIFRDGGALRLGQRRVLSPRDSEATRIGAARGRLRTRGEEATAGPLPGSWAQPSTRGATLRFPTEGRVWSLGPMHCGSVYGFSQTSSSSGEDRVGTGRPSGALRPFPASGKRQGWQGLGSALEGPIKFETEGTISCRPRQARLHSGRGTCGGCKGVAALAAAAARFSA